MLFVNEKEGRKESNTATDIHEENQGLEGAKRKISSCVGIIHGNRNQAYICQEQANL